jgi:hypothetical protein
MKNPKFTESRMAAILTDGEAPIPVSEVGSKHSISELAPYKSQSLRYSLIYRLGIRLLHGLTAKVNYCLLSLFKFRYDE